MNRRFVNKTVIVTGASSGIGAATAKQFAAEGALVVLVARRKEALGAVARDIRGALAVPLDVTDLAGAEALFTQVQQQFGAIHVLVNNAGIHARGPVEGRQVDTLAAMVDVNLRAPVAWCRMALPYLRKAGGGAIVNVGSLSGLAPVAGVATYGATKGGLRAFTYALADELRGSGITASVVSPGLVDTEFFSHEIDKIPPIVFSVRMSSAEAVAGLILDCAHDGRIERVIPRLAYYTITAGSLWPWLMRAARPLLVRIGRRNKNRYLQGTGP